MSAYDVQRWDTVRVLVRRKLIQPLERTEAGAPIFPAYGLPVDGHLHSWAELGILACTCPTCERRDALTLREAVKGHQCRDCTAAAEFGG